jgi:hypothetical protein
MPSRGNRYCGEYHGSICRIPESTKNMTKKAAPRIEIKLLR